MTSQQAYRKSIRFFADDAKRAVACGNAAQAYTSAHDAASAANRMMANRPSVLRAKRLGAA